MPMMHRLCPLKQARPSRLQAFNAGLHKQRGAIALPTVMLLLLAAALAVLHAHRQAVWEQRSTDRLANARAAFEMAESGLAWTRARLNDPSPIDPAGSPCAPSNAMQARWFRDLYAPSVPTHDGLGRQLRPPADTVLTCSIGEDGMPACSCPAPGAGTPSSGAEASFVVSIHAHPQDHDSVHVRSVGCLRASQACGDAPSGAASRDAHAAVSISLKRTLRLALLPRAPLTASGAVAVCGDAALTNDATQVEGWLVHAGARVTVGTSPVCVSGDVPTLRTPLAPPELAMQGFDAALGHLDGSSEAFALRWLGRTWQAFRDESCHVSGGSAEERGSVLVSITARVHRPCTQVWIDGDATVAAGATIGRPASGSRPGAPVLIATASRLRLAADARVHGLVVVDGPSLDDVAAGAEVHGALLVRGEARMSAGAIRLDLNALADLAASGPFERVPGSWIDE